MTDRPTAEEFARAEAIVDSAPVISVLASCEWADLGDDGKVWIATIIREALGTRRLSEQAGAVPTGDANWGDFKDEAVSIFTAMLSAAPTQPDAGPGESESRALRIGWWNDMRQRGVSQDDAVAKINAALAAQPGKGGRP